LSKINVGINGIGRIGRHLLRLFAYDDDINIKAINDINPDLKNWIYTINYDSIYGKNDLPFKLENGKLKFGSNYIDTFHQKNINEVPWENCEVDYVIDSSGVYKNVLLSREILHNAKVKKIIITHSPQEVDFTMVLGVNEEQFEPSSHNLISSSICDATAIAPIAKIIHDTYNLDGGSITTLHPWLSYQNLMDGPSTSVSYPGNIYHHYALGRSAIGNLIPKPTSALEAVIKVIPELDINSFNALSFRTPTEIVGSADITFITKRETSNDEILNLLERFQLQQKFPIIKLSNDPLVSKDYLKENHSLVVDTRWLNVVNKNLIKFVLWYDNEYGYSCNVLRQLKYIHKKVQTIK